MGSRGNAPCLGFIRHHPPALRLTSHHDRTGASAITSVIALLRAVNVGGTGKLAMADLKRICEDTGLHAVRTYIASGNVVFETAQTEAEVKAALEQRLLAHTGKPVGVIVRTAAQLVGVLQDNPFPDAPANRVAAIFLDHSTSPTTLSGVTGQAPHEYLHLGRREIYVHYGTGMGTTKLRIPAAALGTARNMNTIAKLVAMSAPD